MQPLFSNGKAGVGLFFQEEKQELVVRNVVPGGSASHNGQISPGDIIICVDGKSVEGQGIETLRDCIIGNVGTFVELTFLRPNFSQHAKSESPVIFSVTLERKSQTKAVNNNPAENAGSAKIAPSASQSVPLRASKNLDSPVPSPSDAANAELQKLLRRVSDLTYEKADLQSLLDQKSIQGESRQKTIDMLETQLQSSIAENERLTREADAAKKREAQAQTLASSSSSKEVSLVRDNAELQAAVTRLQDALSASEAVHKQNLAAEQQARAAAENERDALRLAAKTVAASDDNIKATSEQNARLSSEITTMRGPVLCVCVCVCVCVCNTPLCISFAGSGCNCASSSPSFLQFICRRISCAA
jgi:hypothetical protein